VNELSSTCTQQKEELLKLASEESGSEDLVAKVNELTSMCNNQKSELSRLSEQESGSEVIRNYLLLIFHTIYICHSLFINFSQFVKRLACL
jgi:hypothetical protein